MSSSSYLGALVFVIVSLALAIYVALDVLKYPDEVWRAAGRTKLVFLIAPIVLAFLCPLLSLLLSGDYFVYEKKKLAEAGGQQAPPPPPAA
jgi:hypothetical protein